MKKITITIIAILAIFAGIACSRSSDWSYADKASLHWELKADVVSGRLTQAQSNCILNFNRSHYDSKADSDAATESEVRILIPDLIHQCRLNPELFRK